VPEKVQVAARFSTAAWTSLGEGAAVGAGMAIGFAIIGAARAAKKSVADTNILEVG
jgi:hypothetical protein